MRITWVLSDQERERRFKKADQSILEAKPRNVLFSTPRKTLIYHSFTIEEQSVVEDIHAKFQIPWLQDFLVFNKDSATNLIKYTYGLSKLNDDTWNNLSDSMHINFIRNVLPKFTELSEIPQNDFEEVIKSPNSRIQLFFRGCFVLQMEKPQRGKETKRPISSQVKAVANNPHLMNSQELADVLSRIELSKDGDEMFLTTYDELYPPHWSGDSGIEQRHRNIIKRITEWPKVKGNEINIWLVTLLSLILALHADFYPLKSKNIMEKLQLKYILLLQRYLRSFLQIEKANKKFLEAMLLLSDTREAWEITNTKVGSELSVPGSLNTMNRYQ